MPNKKNTLREKTWGKKPEYYDATTIAYSHIETHYGYKLLLPYLSKAKVIAEFGCGNGSVIGNIVKIHKQITAYGVDFSDLAIKQAKKLYKGKLHLQVGDAETATFPIKADIALSFFTFEHLDHPEKVFANMLKATRPGGRIVIVCPNYGSPIYPSPCNRKNLVSRMMDGISRDLRLMTSDGEKELLWDKVEPIIDPGMKHVMDHDTTIEPYVFSMKRFIEGKYPKLRIEVCSSGWGTVTRDKVSMKFWLFSLSFKLLSIFGIAPFRFWGPVHMIVIKK